MLHKLIAALLLSLLLLPGLALAFEPGQDQDEEEWVLYDGAIEPADSGDTVREAGAPTGDIREADGNEHVNR